MKTTAETFRLPPGMGAIGSGTTQLVQVRIQPSTEPGFVWLSILRVWERSEDWLSRPLNVEHVPRLLARAGIRGLKWDLSPCEPSAACPFGKPPEDKGGTVYFIREAGGVGPIKIGWSSDPLFRLEALQTGSPVRLEILATTPGPQSLEHELHRKFAAHRSRGEWFMPAPELLAFIEGL